MENIRKELQRVKRLLILDMKRRNKRQREFHKRMEGKKGLDDYLTIDEIQKEFGISRSTFNRYRLKGLKILQNGYKNKITVRKGDYIEFIENSKNGR